MLNPLQREVLVASRPRSSHADVNSKYVAISGEIRAFGLPGVYHGVRSLLRSQERAGLRSHTTRERARSGPARKYNRDVTNAKNDLAAGQWANINVESMIDSSLKGANGDSRQCRWS